MHDGVLTIERRLLLEKDPSHPVFVVKVPPGLGFVDNAPADLFFLRFDDIFNMFHLYPLHYTMVRLFSLSLATQIIRENTPGIAIVDPYYMRDGCLGSPRRTTYRGLVPKKNPRGEQDKGIHSRALLSRVSRYSLATVDWLY